VIEQAVWPDQRTMAQISSAPDLSAIAGGEAGGSRLVSLLMGDRPGGSLVIGTSLNASIREDPEGAATIQEIAARAIRVAPRLASTSVVASWSGRRTMLPDGRPLAGVVPGIAGLEVAGGFSSVGMVTIPGVCRALARAEPQPELDPGRFARRDGD
jgi:glycine/D-amino acid oxidase-like deaminating enzyme